MAAGAEFVEGWLVAQVLGEGAYGEVRLLVHARSGAAVALKLVAAEGGAGAAREAALHRALRHPHVLRCLGSRAHQGQHYVFLEYAAGGELFDRIEPDVGMREADARRYWRQLLLGLQYLHARGVAHRDIKPENLLLDQRDQLKISDFGMATLFRHGSRERLLARVCGTVPYAAPEVLAAAAQPYRAEPADLWAAALVLLAMLAGEIAARDWRSQPAADSSRVCALSAADMDALVRYSQPAQADDLLLTCLPPELPPPRRMTRLWLRGATEPALAALERVLAQRGYPARRLHARLLCIECGAELKMRAWALRSQEERTLVEFRRSRGCGLQFKRRFVQLRDALAPHLADADPGTDS